MDFKNILRKNLAFLYLVIFVLFWGYMAIAPLYRKMWFIENIILLVFLFILIPSYKYFKFSNLSYTLIFLFCVLQTIGAHYTYALVPFDFVTRLFGFERNHYDRLVHFCFGFFLSLPIWEFFVRTSRIHPWGFWAFFVPILFAFGSGAAYESIEMGFALFSDPQASDAFLGSQGDVWDAQKDMALAGFGSVLAMVLVFVFFRKTEFFPLGSF